METPAFSAIMACLSGQHQQPSHRTQAAAEPPHKMSHVDMHAVIENFPEKIGNLRFSRTTGPSSILRVWRDGEKEPLPNPNTFVFFTVPDDSGDLVLSMRKRGEKLYTTGAISNRKELIRSLVQAMLTHSEGLRVRKAEAAAEPPTALFNADAVIRALKPLIGKTFKFKNEQFKLNVTRGHKGYVYIVVQLAEETGRWNALRFSCNIPDGELVVNYDQHKVDFENIWVEVPASILRDCVSVAEIMNKLMSLQRHNRFGSRTVAEEFVKVARQNATAAAEPDPEEHVVEVGVADLGAMFTTKRRLRAGADTVQCVTAANGRLPILLVCYSRDDKMIFYRFRQTRSDNVISGYRNRPGKQKGEIVVAHIMPCSSVKQFMRDVYHALKADADQFFKAHERGLGYLFEGVVVDADS